MKSAAIRLDSFSTQLTASDSSRALSNDLDAAFHRGYEQGLNEGRENSLDALTAALTDLQRHVSTSNEGMVTARREVIADIAPVLSAMIDILAAHSHKDRLCEALMSELRRTEETAQPRKLQIRCAPDLRPDIELCLTKTGHADVRIEETGDEAPQVELIAGKATISFDPQRVVAELQAIIDDILTED